MATIRSHYVVLECHFYLISNTKRSIKTCAKPAFADHRLGKVAVSSPTAPQSQSSLSIIFSAMFLQLLKVSFSFLFRLLWKLNRVELIESPGISEPCLCVY